MRNVRRLLWMGIATSMLIALSSRADTITYVLTSGSATLTVTIPTHPIPSLYVDGQYFEVSSVPTSLGLDDVYFFSDTAGGGLADLFGYNLFGPQVYSGPESDPTMLTGDFQFTQGSGPPVTVHGTHTVAEPGSLGLLGAGLIWLDRLRRQFRV